MYTRQEIQDAVKARGVPAVLEDVDAKIDAVLDTTRALPMVKRYRILAS